MTLVEFLRARLDEDAAEIAKHPDDEDAVEDWQIVARSESNYPCDPYLAIAKKRALAEVEAKRRIIAEVEGVDWLPSKAEDDEPEYAYGLQRAYHHALEILALPYADHPDYDQAWRV